MELNKFMKKAKESYKPSSKKNFFREYRRKMGLSSRREIREKKIQDAQDMIEKLAFALDQKKQKEMR